MGGGGEVEREWNASSAENNPYTEKPAAVTARCTCNSVYIEFRGHTETHWLDGHRLDPLSQCCCCCC